MSSDRDTLTSTLRRFGLARDRLWAVLARTSGIGANDLTALEQLDVNGLMTPRQLADRVGLTSGAVTQLVDRLQRAGWVDRFPHPADGRQRLLGLSTDARVGLPTGLSRYYETMNVLGLNIHGDRRAGLTEFLGDATRATANLAEAYRWYR